MIVANAIPSEERLQRSSASGKFKETDSRLDILVGQKTVAPTIVTDPESNGNPGIFFVFSDLAIRLIGDFVLRCDMLNLDTYTLIDDRFFPLI
jgi:hypothetical protein